MSDWKKKKIVLAAIAVIVMGAIGAYQLGLLDSMQFPSVLSGTYDNGAVVEDDDCTFHIDPTSPELGNKHIAGSQYEVNGVTVVYDKLTLNHCDNNPDVIGILKAGSITPVAYMDNLAKEQGGGVAVSYHGIDGLTKMLLQDIRDVVEEQVSKTVGDDIQDDLKAGPVQFSDAKTGNVISSIEVENVGDTQTQPEAPVSNWNLQGTVWTYGVVPGYDFNGDGKADYVGAAMEDIWKIDLIKWKNPLEPKCDKVFEFHKFDRNDYISVIIYKLDKGDLDFVYFDRDMDGIVDEFRSGFALASSVDPCSASSDMHWKDCGADGVFEEPECFPSWLDPYREIMPPLQAES